MKLFLSYRRDDSAFASQAIHERLSQRFGPRSVFIDVDSIPPGVDFRDYINHSVASCELMLAVIGPTWLSVDKEGKTLLHNPGDFVRIEIESALSHGLPVLPVLAGTATMPSEDLLPEGLKCLAYRQALHVRPGRDFQHDVDNVIRAVASIVDHRPLIFDSKPGNIRTAATGMREVVLPAGTFLMASDSAVNTPIDGTSQKRIRIPKPLFMSVTPVTQGEFEMLMAFNPSKYLGDPKRPVETVSLADAAEFCNALSQSEGLLPYYEIRGQIVAVAGGNGYRLPRETEWEYACRAGTTTRWGFGEDETEAGKYAWYSANANDTTQPVGTKLPNPWGLYEMHGNVWELCWDLTAEAEAGGVMRHVISPPTECILRGGCFLDPAWGLESGYRSSLRVSVRSHRVGFRVLRPCGS